jgi:hypothetical protein
VLGQRLAKEELLRLVEEKSLGSFERRKRRMIAAQNRLEQQGYTLSAIFNLAEDTARLKADPQLRRDVFSVLNMGFTSEAELDAAIARNNRENRVVPQ